MCSNEVRLSILYDSSSSSSICFNMLEPYTKRNIDKLEAVQRRAARFVLGFHDYHPTADLSGKIQKTFQWDSFYHCRTIADLWMFHRLRNNLANIAIPHILVPSVKHSSHYDHIESLHSDAFKYQFFCQRCQTFENHSLQFDN